MNESIDENDKSKRKMKIIFVFIYRFAWRISLYFYYIHSAGLNYIFLSRKLYFDSQCPEIEPKSINKLSMCRWKLCQNETKMSSKQNSFFVIIFLFASKTNRMSNDKSDSIYSCRMRSQRHSFFVFPSIFLLFFVSVISFEHVCGLATGDDTIEQ